VLRDFGPHPTLELKLYAAHPAGQRSTPSHVLEFTDATVSLFPAVHRTRAGAAHEATRVSISFDKIEYEMHSGRPAFQDSWLA
jgi:hypothetical protein